MVEVTAIRVTTQTGEAVNIQVLKTTTKTAVAEAEWATVVATVERIEAVIKMKATTAVHVEAATATASTAVMIMIRMTKSLWASSNRCTQS